MEPMHRREGVARDEYRLQGPRFRTPRVAIASRTIVGNHGLEATRDPHFYVAALVYEGVGEEARPSSGLELNRDHEGAGARTAAGLPAGWRNPIENDADQHRYFRRLVGPDLVQHSHGGVQFAA
jgi:hypothetical protein